ncbi:AmmeMemoRadiSam system protein B [bacterium]|nr:AmmeMemoRadiSam system protein B [bacterium]MBU1433777.1 AmmeMemoRadiSam system protein B [bacterium]MBU1503852.1 AmmeMemoRadiSam system protein B [bacterium]
MCTKATIAFLFLLVFTLQNVQALRPSAVAGSFYENDKENLSVYVKTLLENAKTFQKQEINAIIVPHAGYVFSAPTAVIAYKTLHKKYKNIFLIGSSHYADFDGASIFTDGNYKTPLGEVQVNQEIITSLQKSSPLFTYIPDAHTKEHSLEVQLPFLQTIYGNSLQIIPIIIGTSELKSIEQIAQALKPYFNEENLFVISSDLSHYPAYKDANAADAQTLEALSKNSPKELLNAMSKNENLFIPNLQTSACGWSSLLMLLYLTQDENYTYELLDYTNSGDTKYGDKKKVVGYGALRIYKESQKFFLTSDEKQELRNIAKLSLYEATLKNKKISLDANKISEKLKLPVGAFVTLYKNGVLRGCIGTFEPKEPLYKVVAEMAQAAAQNDTRFEKVSSQELDKIELEISVLTPRQQIHSLDEIILGKHGIYIQKGAKNGTFLPHVAIEMGWNAEQFVGYCAEEKAGIGYDGYKNANLYIYEAIVF